MMTDEEFTTRLEIRLSKYLPLEDIHREKLWAIVSEVRGIERELISREQMILNRQDIHPVCKS